MSRVYEVGDRLVNIHDPGVVWTVVLDLCDELIVKRDGITPIYADINDDWEYEDECKSTFQE